MSFLFDSIGRQVGLSSAQVRMDICRYLDRGGTVLDGVKTADIVDSVYIKQMSLPSTWGGGVEIQAACNVYGVRIAVKSIRMGDSSRPIVFSPVTGRLTYKMLFMTWNGSHYEPAQAFLCTNQ